MKELNAPNVLHASNMRRGTWPYTVQSHKIGALKVLATFCVKRHSQLQVK